MKLFQCLTLFLASRSASATQDDPDIMDVARENGSFTTLVTALEASGLSWAFQQNFFCSIFGWHCKDYTVFAPTDAAFEALGDAAVARLLDEDYAPHLKDLLLYHVVEGKVPSGDIADGAEVETLNHEIVVASVDGSDISLKDLNDDNEDAGVVIPDVAASNGIIHAIDQVLLPSSAKNVAEVAVENGSFTTLLELLGRVDLADYVATTDKLTVFAPTDAAFEALSETVDLDALTDEELANILTYHVAEGEVLTSFDLLTRGDSGVDTVQGEKIDVGLAGSWWKAELRLNDDVQVVIANVLASNGIVHAIDKVLIPPS